MKTHDFKQPVYSIYARAYSSCIITVNDIPIVYSFGAQTSGNGGKHFSPTINHVLLSSGKYNVECKVLPRYGKTTLTEEEYMSIEFYLYELTKFKETSYQFHPKMETPWDGLSEGINYPSFELKTEIEVELPFVLDGWQNSVDLSKIDEKQLFKEVFNYYQQIHAILTVHNASQFLELSKEKMHLQEQAFYFSEERKQEFKQGALKLFNQKLEVEPLVASELQLQLMGYGKLVRLVKHDGSEPLQFKSPKPDEQSNIELEIKLHMRDKNKGFSII